MADPVMIAVAVALATNAVDGLSEAGRSAFASLARLVRRKVAGDPAGRAALVAAETNPDDATGIERLAQTLDTAGVADGAFAGELRRLWGVLRPEIGTGPGDVSNRVSGPVSGVVVQARDVHGGISFGAPVAPRRDP